MIIPEHLPAFSQTLLAGGYNLFVGSGVSLDSKNGARQFLRSAEVLRQELCRLKGARENTSLPRVVALLNQGEVQQYLTVPYSRCTPGPSIKHLPNYLWRRLFSLNIDDAVEALYEAPSSCAKQSIVPINYDAPLEPTPNRNELHAIHLHGWVREAASGYVFSTTEYARVMRGLNPWMHMLSEILATEPFIIAGTSLNEIDLEYYLSHRSSASPRRGKGPSLLIEPNPDVATEADCRRYELLLVKATFQDFLEWIHREFPTPPTIAELVIPPAQNLFPGASQLELLKFFTDFQLIAAHTRPAPQTPPAFLYGRQPTWEELDAHIDIPRLANLRLEERLPSPSKDPTRSRATILLDEPGTGKSTVARRVVHDLANLGRPVLAVQTLNRLDVSNAIAVLKGATSPVILLVDNLADYVEQVVEILENSELVGRVTVLGADRSYRKEHLDVLLRNIPIVVTDVESMTRAEILQLIERYRGYGLIGAPSALTDPESFASRIAQDSVAIAVCRILSDFRPLDAIVDSLWSACPHDDRDTFAVVALAQHCYGAGLRYSVANRLAEPARGLGPLLADSAPLRLTENPLNDEYLLPLNPTIANRLIHRLANRDQDTLTSLFVLLAGALAPHVNVRAIMKRSPEARLAGRLFDYDKVVKELIGRHAEAFYLAVQGEWAWNSRYWEQRALLAAESDLKTALQYARHAVSLERHSFTLTTLAKILLDTMLNSHEDSKVLFDEAFSHLESAIQREAQRHRSSVHPFGTLLTGTIRYLERNGRLTDLQRQRLSGYTIEARSRFPGDPLIEASLRKLDPLLSSPP